LLAALTILTPHGELAATGSPSPVPRTLAAAPAAAPQSVTAKAGEGRVFLEWTPVPGATRYHVFRAAHGTWELAPAARVSGTAFRNWGLTNGTTYSFMVLPVNAGGTGPASSIVSATPLAPPTDVRATAGDTQVTLTWTAAAGATGYTVYRSTSWQPASMVPIASGIAATMFIDTGLTNGTKYYYRLQTLAGTEVSAQSPTVSAKPLPPPPASAPGDLTATPGNARVVLAWTAVADATGYKIFRTTTDVWDTRPTSGTQATTYRDSRLANGAAYSYRVAAYNMGGLGPFSTVVTATPLAPPPAPTGVTATAGDGEATLTWTPAGDAVTYNVYRSTSPTQDPRTPLASGLTTPSLVDRPVQNGLTYYYRVTALNIGGESPRSDRASALPEAPPMDVDAETTAAFRLLRQATWGPRPGEVDALKLQGRDAFLDSQLAAAPSAYPDVLFNLPLEVAQEHFMALALRGDDQLRQRVGWALHKIWVVSGVEVPGSRAMVTYYRLLMNGAFGNYRDLMRDVTLNPAMGRYLNMLNNRSQTITGTPPNENYARELMQLFTIGIPTLNQNGTPVVDGAGQPVPSYTEQDVKELARILTGWTFGDGSATTVPRGLARENYGVPMEAVERFHDAGAKTFLGQEFTAGQSAQQDLDQALDVLFNHPNLAPFVSRQLIQQLVTSNPSGAYVAAIAAVFNDNGAGVRGDLAAVVRAILTHPEASASTAVSGKLSEPVLFVVSILRALGAGVTDHPFMSDKASAMGQRIFYPPSVFSYFSPGYRVRGTDGGRGMPLGGPEFQILTTVTALERANFVGDLLGGHFGGNVTVDYTPFMDRAVDAGALVDYCSLLFMGGRMSPEQRAEIVSAVRATPPTDRRERSRTALYLTLAAAQAQVDW
jgi:uncharacterized protein (DUF1800 family)/fibronectin type 3 domain-containing protein